MARAPSGADICPIFLFSARQGVPSIGAGEDGGGRQGFGFFVGEHFCPRHAGLRSGAGTGAGELGVEGRLLGVGLVPVVPALWADVSGELGAKENGAGEVSPWAAEIDAFF